jgi:hypothetical protein
MKNKQHMPCNQIKGAGGSRFLTVAGGRGPLHGGGGVRQMEESTTSIEMSAPVMAPRPPRASPPATPASSPASFSSSTAGSRTTGSGSPQKERRREALAMASVSGGDPLAASSERGVLRAWRPPSSSVGDDRRSKATATTGDGSAWGRK